MQEKGQTGRVGGATGTAREAVGKAQVIRLARARGTSETGRWIVGIRRQVTRFAYKRAFELLEAIGKATSRHSVAKAAARYCWMRAGGGVIGDAWPTCRYWI